MSYVLEPIDESLACIGPFDSEADAVRYANETDADGESVYALEGFTIRWLDPPKDEKP